MFDIILEDIDLEYIHSPNITGATSAGHFKHLERYYRRKFNNPTMIVLMFAVSFDGTELGRGSKRKAVPLYVSLLNLKLQKLVSESGTDLIGFIPEMSMSVQKLFYYMNKCGIKLKGNQQKSLTILRKWIMQECLKNIFHVVYEMNKSGPVKMMIGKGGTIHDVMLAFSGCHGNYKLFYIYYVVFYVITYLY